MDQEASESRPALAEVESGWKSKSIIFLPFSPDQFITVRIVPDSRAAKSRVRLTEGAPGPGKDDIPPSGVAVLSSGLTAVLRRVSPA